MAKIRGVKPEFWTDEKIVELSRDARLLFIGLWNFACDNGHVDDKPRQIKMRVFPGDDDTHVEEWLEELVAQGRIEREGGVITINRFAHHQKPHKRWWSTCDLPWCVLPDGASPHGRNGGATVAPQEDNGGATADGDGDGDGDGDIKAPPAPRKRGTRIDPDFITTAEMQEWAAENGLGHLDLDAITEEFVDYWIGVPGSKGTKLDWDATWRNRVREVAKRAAGPAGRAPTKPALPLPTVAELRRMEAERDARERGESA